MDSHKRFTARRWGWGWLLCNLLYGALLAVGGCAHLTPGGSKEVAKDQATGRSVPEAELKADLQRFTQSYFDRSGEALEQMEPGLTPSLRADLLRRLLIYDSSALAIATGPVPAVNLLDMLVFTRLTRESFESHWLPKRFGENAQPLLEVLRQAESEIWATGSKLLTNEQEQGLNRMIETWQSANPDRTRVELVRLDQFSKLVGKQAVDKTASGAMSSVKAMGHTVDAAVLLGERAMFVGQFMPSLIRLQARLAALEMYADGASVLSDQEPVFAQAAQLLQRTEKLMAEASALTERAQGMKPMLEDGAMLADKLQRVSQEARLLTEALGPLSTNLTPLLEMRTDARGQQVTALERVLEQSSALSERSLLLLEEVRSMVPAQGAKKDAGYAGLASALERGVRRVFWYLVLLGVVWTTLFWGGYYLVRRRMERPPEHPRPRGGHAAHRPSSAS